MNLKTEEKKNKFDTIPVLKEWHAAEDRTSAQLHANQISWRRKSRRKKKEGGREREREGSRKTAEGARTRRVPGYSRSSIQHLHSSHYGKCLDHDLRRARGIMKDGVEWSFLVIFYSSLT